MKIAFSLVRFGLSNVSSSEERKDKRPDFTELPFSVSQEPIGLCPLSLKIQDVASVDVCVCAGWCVHERGR